jgi:hypothetical protein
MWNEWLDADGDGDDDTARLPLDGANQMWIPNELDEMASRLKAGHRVNRKTVRDLLHIFSAERRGFNNDA